MPGGTQAPPDYPLPVIPGTEQRLLFQGIPFLNSSRCSRNAQVALGLPSSEHPSTPCSFQQVPVQRQVGCGGGLHWRKTTGGEGHHGSLWLRGALNKLSTTLVSWSNWKSQISPSFWSELVWQLWGNISGWLTLPTGELAV